MRAETVVSRLVLLSELNDQTELLLLFQLRLAAD